MKDNVTLFLNKTRPLVKSFKLYTVFGGILVLLLVAFCPKNILTKCLAFIYIIVWAVFRTYLMLFVLKCPVCHKYFRHPIIPSVVNSWEFIPPYCPHCHTKLEWQ